MQNRFYRLATVIAGALWLIVVVYGALIEDFWATFVFASISLAVLMAFCAAIVWALNPRT